MKFKLSLFLTLLLLVVGFGYIYSNQPKTQPRKTVHAKSSKSHEPRALTVAVKRFRNASDEELHVFFDDKPDYYKVGVVSKSKGSGLLTGPKMNSDMVDQKDVTTIGKIKEKLHIENQYYKK